MVFLGKDIFKKVISVCKRLRCLLSLEGNFSKVLKRHRGMEKTVESSRRGGWGGGWGGQDVNYVSSYLVPGAALGF